MKMFLLLLPVWTVLCPVFVNTQSVIYRVTDSTASHHVLQLHCAIEDPALLSERCSGLWWAFAGLHDDHSKMAALDRQEGGKEGNDGGGGGDDGHPGDAARRDWTAGLVVTTGNGKVV
ncbi:hypothetical protein ACOMHN_002463 [Nucella lapillus]